MALGADVEFFIVQEGQETIVPALVALETAEANGYEGITPVIKEIAGPDFDNYASLEVVLNTAKVTEDGAAIETPCNPGDNASELMLNIWPGVEESIKIARTIPGGSLTAQPLVWLDPEHIRTRDELRVLGCAPDINYWQLMDLRIECKPEQDPEKTLWRTGGGHIHFSPKDVHYNEVQENIIVLCDLLLGTLDVVLEHSADAIQRRTMYGQPGKHRIQGWGVEYRTMSNAWFVNPSVARAVLEVAEVVHAASEANVNAFAIADRVNWRTLVKAITECDQRTCAKIFLYTVERLNKYGLEVTPLSFALIKEIYQAGGVAELYGYDMEGWLH